MFMFCSILNEVIAMPSSPLFPTARSPHAPKEAAFPEKTDEGMIEAMRKLVERTRWSYRVIGAELGVSAATVSRYARQEGWQRPAAPPAPAQSTDAEATTQPGDRRERIAQKLWTLAERHAEILETQPIERAQRSLQPLARLTRTLGEIDKHVRAPLPAHEYEIDAPRPRRSLHELRDELAAHLERINREEGYGWEVREWWFEGGGGI